MTTPMTRSEKTNTFPAVSVCRDATLRSACLAKGSYTLEATGRQDREGQRRFGYSLRLSFLSLLSRSFCQKCGWQVTAKHAYTLRMLLCMKWHGAWLYGVHRTCAETAAVSCGTSHASAVKYTTSVDIQKTRSKMPVTTFQPHLSAVSLLKRLSQSS